MTRASGEWSIQQVARLAGTTSRALRHYDELGLLPPSRVGDQGYRYYDQAALLRLQRILLLRDLGLGLPAIGELLDGGLPAPATLRTHLELLELERDRLERRIDAVRTTLRKSERGEPLMAEEMFDGFDHDQYREEVVDRWGEEAYRRSDAWYRSLSDRDRRGFAEEQAAIAADFAAALEAGLPADGPEAAALARRQFAWVARAWRSEPSAEAFAGLGEMYVADPRFTASYDAHGTGTAAYVRDAMTAFAERELR
jgi:MerR family transcriptional regulator, thiopeptide resistance regulator